ncbi:LutC/YkgG family protein [Cytobacillus dafuensis]|uniref:Lactate utilization protein C n=1 Tax=Cytobacillus dafuensis TaxID=1742359 RepID=A0A5B8Z2Q8_CYTDA|nr:lactate utilization protein C [Cytobacillus dafuensis]QED47315.1 lactate utilization protein C [Cytobacillus dafuensis]
MSGEVQNRDVFLHKIAQRLGRNQVAKAVERPIWSFHPQDTVLKGASTDELLEVLIKQCKSIHTDIFVTNKTGLSEVLNNIVIEFGGGSIVRGKDPRFEEYGLSPLFNQIWPNENIDIYEWDSTKDDVNIKNAEKASIGITISDITLAESGTSVLFSSKDRGRSINFLPLASVIIIPKSSTVPRMTQAARLIRDKIKKGEHLSSCINFITGPSNSADIEMNLVVGVHGPVKAAYVVVEDV